MTEARVLDQLAAAPWRLRHGDQAAANAPVALLRWLLESLKYEESYLEIRSSTNHSFQLALAIRLAEKEAGMWRTNLALVVDSLTGFSPLSTPGNPQGWSVTHPQAPARFDMVQQKEWTVVGISKEDNSVMRDVLQHLGTSDDPFGQTGTNLWLTMDADSRWLAKTLGGITNPPINLPKIFVAVTGDGGNVLTRSTLTFADPLPDISEPWTIPKGLIHEPLTSLAAARGTHPVLANLRPWTALHLGEAPNQFFLWSNGENPFQVYLAAPVPDAQARIASLTEILLNKANPWLQSNGPKLSDSGIPQFEKLPNAGGVRWTIPGLWPFLRSIESGGTRFLFAGLTPEQNAGVATPIQDSRIAKILSRTNLVYCEWESTAARMDTWLPVLQTTRVLARKAPLSDKSLPLMWLTAIRPRISETETYVTRTSAHQLELHRKSTLGFNAAELHLIADWIASPQFPLGLHTLLAPPASTAP